MKCETRNGNQGAFKESAHDAGVAGIKPSANRRLAIFATAALMATTVACGHKDTGSSIIPMTDAGCTRDGGCSNEETETGGKASTSEGGNSGLAGSSGIAGSESSGGSSGIAGATNEAGATSAATGGNVGNGGTTGTVAASGGSGGNTILGVGTGGSVTADAGNNTCVSATTGSFNNYVNRSPAVDVGGYMIAYRGDTTTNNQVVAHISITCGGATTVSDLACPINVTTNYNTNDDLTISVTPVLVGPNQMYAKIGVSETVNLNVGGSSS